MSERHSTYGVLLLGFAICLTGCSSGNDAGAPRTGDSDQQQSAASPSGTGNSFKPVPPSTAFADKTAEQFAISADGRVAAVCFSRPTEDLISMWDLSSGELMATVEQPDRFSSSWRHGVALSPDGSLIASVRHQRQDRRLKVWETKTGKLQKQFEITWPGHVFFSQDGNKLYWHRQGGNPVVIDLETDQQEKFGLEDKHPTHVVFSPTEPLAAMSWAVIHPATMGGEGTLCLYDMEHHTIVNRKMWEWAQMTDDDALIIHAIEYSGNGRKLADAGLNRIRIRNAKTLEVEDAISGGGNAPKGMDVAPNGRFVAVAVEGESAGIWDTSGAAILKEIADSRGCIDLQFLSNGVLVLAFGGGPLRFVDPENGREIPLSEISGIQIAAALNGT